MSFRCQSCNKVIWSQPIKKVVETRRKTYINEDADGREKVSEGYETVRELDLCQKCSTR